jgi:hypothetical protein
MVAWLAIAAICTSIVQLPADGQTAPPASGKPAARPATSPAAPAANGPAVGSEKPPVSKVDNLFNYLMKEYTGLLGKTKDRLGRSLILVCMSRVPRADASAEILKVLKTDKDVLVQTVAWQCMLARASGLSDAEFKQWMDATQPLVARGAFRGDLRMSLAQVLAAAGPDKRTRDIFALLFASTNSLQIQDRHVIGELGNVVAAWHDAATVDWLLARFATLNDAFRAEEILRGAGIGGNEVPSAMTHFELGSAAMWQTSYREYSAWWAQEKKGWTPAKQQGEPWRQLQGQYVPSVSFTAAVDPNDDRWYRDLELRSPGLRTFGVALLLDTTGSMQSAIMWLRSDVRRIMQALGLVALEPQIGITFYRDFGDEFVTKTTPLTGKVEALVKDLNAMNAKGGGDEPEAIREALSEALNKNPWSTSAKSPKALVIIGDAQPHPETNKDCLKLVTDAAAKGFRTYVVKVHSGYEKVEGWPNLDALATAGNGKSLEVTLFGAMFGGSLPNAPVPPTLGKVRDAPAMPAMPGGFPGGPSGVPAIPGGIGGGDGLPIPPAPFDPPAAAPEPKETVKKPARRTTNSEAHDVHDDTSRPPGERVVTRVLIDVVNPQYGDRVQPVVATLWQMLADFEPEKRMPTPPIPKMQPPPMVNIPPPRFNPPPVRPPVPVQPYDPQKQK